MVCRAVLLSHPLALLVPLPVFPSPLPMPLHSRRPLIVISPSPFPCHSPLPVSPPSPLSPLLSLVPPFRPTMSREMSSTKASTKARSYVVPRDNRDTASWPLCTTCTLHPSTVNWFARAVVRTKLPWKRQLEGHVDVRIISWGWGGHVHDQGVCL